MHRQRPSKPTFATDRFWPFGDMDSTPSGIEFFIERAWHELM